MSIRKKLALLLWPDVEAHYHQLIHDTGYALGKMEAEFAAREALKQPKTTEQSAYEDGLPYVPHATSARDIAGYCAKQAAEEIKAALLKLNESTGGMSAHVDVDWREYSFMSSSTPFNVLDGVIVRTGEVSARA